MGETKEKPANAGLLDRKPLARGHAAGATIAAHISNYAQSSDTRKLQATARFSDCRI